MTAQPAAVRRPARADPRVWTHCTNPVCGARFKIDPEQKHDPERLCPRCVRGDAPGTTTVCRERRILFGRGLCTFCGAPVGKGELMCEIHRPRPVVETSGKKQPGGCHTCRRSIKRSCWTRVVLGANSYCELPDSGDVLRSRGAVDFPGMPPEIQDWARQASGDGWRGE